MAKTATIPLSAQEERYRKQIERNLVKIREIRKEMAAEWKATAHLRRPRPSILEEVKAILGC